MSRFHVVAARPVLLFIQVFIVFLLLSGSASAQFTGNIQGTVEDPSGAAIPQAKVALLNLATQASATTTTDATGGFRFLSLAPGPYKITVEAAGFAKAEATVEPRYEPEPERAHLPQGGHRFRNGDRHLGDSAGQHDRDPKSDDARDGGAVHPAPGGPQHVQPRHGGAGCFRDGNDRVEALRDRASTTSRRKRKWMPAPTARAGSRTCGSWTASTSPAPSGKAS